ncbi:hypothetical protein HO133_003125 [Letharia lupina]|uniref:Major facilitator superfamily (MFS) profile domain-containing protein n=1 Tax=Letharia lupina TaxID=560253 RepID=A0A8H6CC32_9LECA|nr:uncharacterized protein HO133_003125 [Letharia lupina]KAF6220692.1 hypothetical protein HO133_003125 [Letharia lupina]
MLSEPPSKSKPQASLSKLPEPAPPKPTSLSTDPPSPLYTIFTVREKRLLTLLLGLTTITSPLTATIYFPLLPLLSTHYHASPQAINLTITIYIIFQALSPAIFATLSDSLGRRIVYLITLTLYVLSNLGLALEHNSYATLVVLRAFQSLGASAAFAVSYGVVADVCVPAERGKMVGPVSMALNLGTCVGPIVGGWVAFKSGDYNWVFWFLVVIGIILLVAVGGLLPETARTVVGNGSVKTQRWWERTWLSFLRDRSKRTGGNTARSAGREEDPKPRMSDGNCGETAQSKINAATEAMARTGRTVKMLNPLPCLRVILWKDAALVLWMHASYYMVDYSIQTSIPSSFKDIYHFNELEIGLAYLPRGIGIISGGYVNGKLMDRNYRTSAKEIGLTIDRERGDDLQQFPIERARTRGSWYLLAILTGALIGYGWALDQRSHVSIPLLLQFIQGFLGTSIYTIFNTLLVDVFPESPSTAAAAASISRCALAASGVAAVQPLVGVLGRGWYFTALAVLTGGVGSVVIWLIREWGAKWRHERVAKTTRACGKNDAGEAGLKDQARLPGGTREEKLSKDVAGAATTS